MGDAVQIPGKILVVDDTPANVDLLRGLLSRERYSVCTAVDGEAALSAVAAHAPDLILLDVMMPKLDGFEVCRRLKQDPATRLTPIVLLTSLQEREDKIQGINAGADDFLTKPVNAQELRARVRSLVRLKRYTDDLDSAESVIFSLAATIEARDPYTQGHCQRLARYAVALGAHRDLPDDDLAALHRGGLLHDVGKVCVPDGVLLKPGPLTADEFVVMQRHTVVGDTILGNLRSLRPVRPIVRHHHERLDGSGYPDGLRGDAIPLLAQIVGLVDVYDALMTDRPYRHALPAETVYAELLAEAAKGWRDRTLVEDLIVLGRSGRLEQPAGSPELQRSLASSGQP